MIRLHNHDCLEVLKMMIEDEVFVDSIVTDPPYHLTSTVERFGKEGSAAPKDKDGLYNRIDRGFMGQEWDGGDIAFRKETWELCFKVLKPGGHLLAFSGSRTYHRMAVAIEDAGFDIRDQIMWLYGSGFPKSHNIGKAVDKKLGNERVAVGERTRNVKPFDDGNGWNSNNTTGNHIYTKGNSEWEGWGTALKPAHEPLVLARKPLSEKSVVDNVLKHRTGAINIDGCRVETDPEVDDMLREVDRKESRFPSNVMHDGSDSIKELFEDKIRYFYCAKTSKAEKNQGLDSFSTKQTQGGGGGIGDYKDDVNSASGKFGSEKAPSKNIHPTVKPINLMKYLCRLITPKGGTVLDPFMGSGSTGMAAKEENFDFVGIEKQKEYFNIASARIESVETKSTLEGFYE